MMLVDCEERKENSEVWIETASLKVPIDERFWSPNGLSSCDGDVSIFQKGKSKRNGRTSEVLDVSALASSSLLPGLFARRLTGPSPAASILRCTDVLLVTPFSSAAPPAGGGAPASCVLRFSASLLWRWLRCFEYRLRLAASPRGLHQKK